MTVQQHVLNWLYSVLTSVRQQRLYDLCCATADVHRNTKTSIAATTASLACSAATRPSPHAPMCTVRDLFSSSDAWPQKSNPSASPDGASALLVHLSGTLPVNFRGSTYRFPLSIWIPHRYPREPPIIYVTPTDSMVIRPGQHVDQQGQVYHPYLVGWQQFWDVCARAGRDHDRTVAKC